MGKNRWPAVLIGSGLIVAGEFYEHKPYWIHPDHNHAEHDVRQTTYSRHRIPDSGVSASGPSFIGTLSFIAVIGER